MRTVATIVAAWAGLAVPQVRAQANDLLMGQTQALTHEIMTNGTAYADLGELTTIGPRLDGSPMRYNQPDPYLPDFVMCRAELAPILLGAIRDAWR